ASGTAFGVNSSTPVPIDAAALAKLQILVPGESAVSGDVPNAGKTGVPQTQTAGAPFTIIVSSIRVVDAYYNMVSTNGSVNLALSDIYGTLSTGTVNIARLT